MMRNLLIGCLILTSCRTLSNNSASKSITPVDDRPLIEQTSIDVSKGEPISLMIDVVSNRPQADATFLAEVLYITLLQADSDEPCSRPLTKVVTRGDQGAIPFMISDKDEESGYYVYGKSLDVKPVGFKELLLSFEKGSKKQWAKQCRVTVTAPGFWSASGDLGYDVVSDDPKRDAAVRAYSAGFEHRLSHFMWHTSRGAWPAMLTRLEDLKATNAGKNEAIKASDQTRADQALLEKSMAQYEASGWVPPRYFQKDDEKTALSGAGEDFLYMHRRMIERLTTYLKDRDLKMIPAWKTLPDPSDPQFTLGPKGHAALPDQKSDEYYYTTERIWEKAYKLPDINDTTIAELAKDLLEGRKKTNTLEKTPDLEAAVKEVKALLKPADHYQFTGLKNMSLSEYGHLLEMTLHNDLHTRYAYLGTAARPAAADPLDRTTWKKDWAYTFDNSNYDSLNDTFSSHVHPWFYRIHGWVDDRIGDWLKAHDFTSIGTKDECAKAKGRCYVWLSDERYVGAGVREPWEGPMVADEKVSSDTTRMSLHAHKAPVFTPDVVAATKGFRAPYASMNRRLVSPEIK